MLPSRISKSDTPAARANARRRKEDRRDADEDCGNGGQSPSRLSVWAVGPSSESMPATRPRAAHSSGEPPRHFTALAANSRYSANLSSWNSPNGVPLYPNGTFRLCLLTEMPLRLVAVRRLEGSSITNARPFSRATPRNHTISSFPANRRLKRMFEFQSSV
jgi:hypothetical protein